jgi:GNAT superfamily N-acetyltransferase
MARYRFEEVTSEHWVDFEKLFGENGACGGCWCQWWRIPKGGQLWEDTKGKKAKKMMKALFKHNEVTGLLAYDGDKAVAWCSYGPRRIFPRTETAKAYRRDDIAGVWSINCFFIDKNYRRVGLSRKLLAAALKFMRKQKVKIVEAYPVTLTKAGKQLPAAFSYTGSLNIFEDEGFEIIQCVSPSRPMVRRSL